MDKNFSWMKIHVEGPDYVLYLYNKTGLVKEKFRSRDLNRVVDEMEKREDMKKRVQKALGNALESLKNDPAALARLQKFHNERKLDHE